MTADDLFERIRKHYAAPEWAVFAQVRSSASNAPGTRVADAIAFNLWPSRGMPVHGFEIKVSRRDWLRELKSPHKADEVAAYCDYWTLVVSDPAFVKDGELPETWGLFVPGGTGLTEVVAPERTASRDMDRPFVAALLRRAHEFDVHALMSAAMAEAYATGEQRGVASAEGQIRDAVARADRLRDEIAAFSAAAGVDLNYHWPRALGEAVRVVLSDSLDERRKTLAWMVREAERFAQAVRAQGLIPDDTPAWVRREQAYDTGD